MAEHKQQHHDNHEDEHEEHEEHINHEAWVIPYADLLTLLMAMFIALFAISTVDLEKFRQLAAGFNKELGGGKKLAILESGGVGIMPGSGPQDEGGVGAGTSNARPSPTSVVGGPAPTVVARAEALDPASPELRALGADVRRVEAEAREQLDSVKKRITADAETGGFAGNLSFRQEERGLVVTIVTDQVLFDSGRATITPAGAALLEQVGAALGAVPNRLAIEGHTDSLPISTYQFPSNWELSTARAGAVARFLEERVGIESGRLSSAGLGEHRPVADNATSEGRARNRRVEVVVASDAAEKTAQVVRERTAAAEKEALARKERAANADAAGGAGGTTSTSTAGGAKAGATDDGHESSGH